jgi:hypothetical protein
LNVTAGAVAEHCLDGLTDDHQPGLAQNVSPVAPGSHVQSQRERAAALALLG